MSRVSNLIKTTREKRKITQQELSDYLGVRVQFISLIENGRSKLPLDKAPLVCASIGLKKKELVDALMSDYAEQIETYLN